MIRGDQLVRDAVASGDRDALRAILAEVCHTTRMGFAAIARVTDERWIACQVEDRIEFGLEPGDELEIKTTICDDIRRCGAAVIIDSVSDNLEWRTHPTPMLYGFESYASLPIFLSDGSFFGTLCAIDPAPNSLSGKAIVGYLEDATRRVAAILSDARDA